RIPFASLPRGLSLSPPPPPPRASSSVLTRAARAPGTGHPYSPPPPPSSLPNLNHGSPRPKSESRVPFLVNARSRSHEGGDSSTSSSPASPLHFALSWVSTLLLRLRTPVAAASTSPSSSPMAVASTAHSPPPPASSPSRSPAAAASFSTSRSPAAVFTYNCDVTPSTTSWKTDSLSSPPVPIDLPVRFVADLSDLCGSVMVCA
ncbi:unnamed protein product, partial [Urochloa humidicola]